jgi:hypothetical protein
MPEMDPARSSSLPTDYIRDALLAIGAAERAIGLRAPEKVRIAPGLTEIEFRRLQQEHGVVFPPDLRAVLSTGLPLGAGFPDWRGESSNQIHDRMQAPVDGVLFDVEVNAFWYPPWGSRPAETAAAMAIARERLAAVPVLVPVYAHRCIPTEPMEEGNPIFSVWQTDVIYYGDDLAGYFAGEFDAPRPAWCRTTPRRIPFWSDLVDLNNQPRPARA